MFAVDTHRVSAEFFVTARVFLARVHSCAHGGGFSGGGGGGQGNMAAPQISKKNVPFV